MCRTLIAGASLALLVAIAACERGGAARAPFRAASDDTSRAAVAVGDDTSHAGGAAEPTPSARATTGDTLRARVELTIGEGADVEQMFGKVSGLALDDAGRLYVADFLEARLVVFGADGRPLATIGRKGRGPGEFEAPTGPALAPDGTLHVRDLSAVKRFAVDPATGIASRYEDSFAGPALANWTSLRSSAIDRSGRFYFPHRIWESARDTVAHFYLRYDTAGAFVDTVPVPYHRSPATPTAFYWIGPGDGRMVPGLNRVPFAPEPVWTVTAGGTVVSGDARRYELVESDARGRVLRQFGRPVAPRPVVESERDDSLRALRARIDSAPVPLARLQGVPEEVRARRLPETYPAYVGVVAADDGSVWVRRWPPADGRARTLFDVFDAERRFRAVVELPIMLAPEPAPAIRGDVVVGVVRDPATDLATVVRLRLPASPLPRPE
ncbi:MAG TPA: hypothetical protein VFS08_01625 [Gemmatimonadaceae bacterium]|nr:hypothetical protein [Gemmatimonadaceae bacterium]